MVLQLRCLVGGIVGLSVHGVVRLSGCVWALMSAGVCAVAIDGAVAVACDGRLVLGLDVGVVLPVAIGCGALGMGICKRICYPECCVVGIVVAVVVVTIRSAAVSGVSVSRFCCRSFESGWNFFSYGE